MLSVLRHAGANDIGYALLEYRVSNRPAETLYHKLGFQYLHRRKRYYQDNGEDAMVVAIVDLGSPLRRERLDDLYRLWFERFPYEVSVDF
jgi:ribosomal-protein-alanine N-acetyltransferase